MMPLVRFITIFALVASLPAAEPVAEDADLPAPFEPTMAKELLEHPPFTRIVDLEGSLQLTGVAYVEGRPVATFVNRATQERMIVSEAPNALGWRIVEATPSNDLSDTEVQLMIGTEVVTMHYGDEQLTPGVAKKGVPTSLSSSGGRSPDSQGMSRDGERVRTSSYLGENGRELYASLSSDARGKLKDALRAHIEKHPEQSMEQHSAYAQKTFNKLKNADSGTPSTKVPKGEKPKKKP